MYWPLTPRGPVRSTDGVLAATGIVRVTLESTNGTCAIFFDMGLLSLPFRACLAAVTFAGSLLDWFNIHASPPFFALPPLAAPAPVTLVTSHHSVLQSLSLAGCRPYNFAAALNN